MARLLLKDLTPGGSYKIQLRAVEGDSVSEWSRLFALTPTSDTVAPAAPTGVTWNDVGDAFIATWSPVTTDTLGVAEVVLSYEMEFTASAVSKVVSIPQQTGTTISYTLDFSENVALFGTPKPAVDFRVRAVNNKGIKSAWTSTFSDDNPAPQAPTAPGTGSVAEAGIDSITLKWTPPTDTDLIGYNVYTGASAGFTPSAGNKIYFGNANTFVYRTTTYSPQFFKIFSVDKFNQESSANLAGNATPVAPAGSDTTAPATPASVTATIVTSADASSTVANLTWPASSEPDLGGYRVRYRKNGDTNWTYVTYGSDITAATVLGLVPYVNYDFQIQAFDFSANESAYTTGTNNATGASNSAPSQPAAPGAVSNTMQIQVTPTGTKQAGGAMEADVKAYKVYASTSTGFTPAAANMLGTIDVGPAMVATFPIPAGGGAANQTWYVKVIAVDTGNLDSPASNQTTSTPTLIASTNIVDLAVTNAKITSMVADKITAGLGIINDLTVKSKLTLGDASNVGYIETYDYTTSGGTTGAQFSKNGIIIKTGAIEAPALKIQVGTNIMPYAWATMDLPYSSRPLAYIGTGTLTPSDDTVQFQHGTQSLKATVSGTIPLDMVMASSTTDDNIIIPEQGVPYIISMWVRSPTTNMPTISVRSANVSQSSVSAKRVSDDVNALVVNTWTRIYIVTSALNVSKAQVRVSLNGTGDWNFDSVQVEKLSPGNTTNKPSTWYPPAVTSIDGNMIRTGEIRSTNNNTINGVSEPVWSIPLSGAATFSAMRVLGNTVIGNGPTDSNSILASSNYIAGATGWRMNASGLVEFRQVVADSFDGQAIKTNTLSVSQLSGGTTEKVITLGDGSSILAVGDMGEQVGHGAYGFKVWGPRETPVTNKAATTTDVTLTTGIAHNFVVGQKIVVKINDTRFDGQQTVVSTPTTTTFTYSLSGAAVTSVATTGLVQGNNPLASEGPTYISFPTDGTQPNIISGELTSSTIIVTEGMSIRKTTNVESGGKIILNSFIERPKTAPSVVKTYSPMPFSNVYWDTVGFAKRGTDYYRLAKNPANVWDWGVYKYDLNGELQSMEVGTGQSGTGFKEEMMGFVYSSAYSGRFYQLYWETQTNNDKHLKIRSWDTSWNILSEYTVEIKPAAFAEIRFFPVLGWDFINNRLLIAYKTASGASGNVTVQRFLLSTSGTQGLPTATDTGFVGTTGLLTVTNNKPAAVMIGNFDFGSQKMVYKSRATTGNGNSNENLYDVLTFGTQWTTDSNNPWPVSTNLGNVGGAIWDTDINKFVDFIGDSRRIYEGVDTFIADGGTYESTVGYTWYDTVSGAETDMSPRLYWLPVQRAKYIVNIAPIPLGGVGTPNRARIYAANSGADIYVSSPTSYKLRTTVIYPSTSIDMPITNSATTPPISGANGFATGTPGQIVSATGNSFWRGDDTAQFYQLVLNSSTDVNISAGNKPALRIGDVAAAHMRVDANEFQAMLSDTAVAKMIINQGGGQIQLGKGSQPFTCMDFGFRGLTCGPGGQDNVPHNCPTTPDFIAVIPFTTGAFRHVQVTAKTATNFTVQVMDAAGAAVANSTLQIFWMALSI